MNRKNAEDKENPVWIFNPLAPKHFLRTHVFNHRTGMTKHQIRKLQSQKESVLLASCPF